MNDVPIERRRPPVAEFSGPLSVLLVEDSPMARTVAKLYLESGLGGDLRLFTAETLCSALDQLQQHDVELVLLDLNLPDCQGLSTLQSVLRSHPDVTVVVLSSEGEEEAAIGAIRLGAQDYIVKGTQVTDQLLVRTIRLALERSARRAMEKELQQIHQQMELAQAIQQRLLPDLKQPFAHLDVAARCLAAEQMGGDYYDLIGLPDGSVNVVIGDVSGHGIGPSMVMIETRACIRTLSTMGMSIDQIMAGVNGLLIEDLKDHGFVTLFMAQFDSAGRLSCYASAGHPGFLIGDEGKVTWLTSDSPPLGIVANECFVRLTVPRFSDGDSLVLFTDGISEATADHREFLGVQTILDEVVRHRAESAGAILNRIFELAGRLDLETPQHDDRTAVIIKPNSH